MLHDFRPFHALRARAPLLVLLLGMLSGCEGGTGNRIQAFFGSPQALTALGKLHARDGSVLGDHERALAYFDAGARAGDAEAQHWLGSYLDNGWYTKIDRRAAREWFLLAAQQGLVEAQFDLALTYERDERAHDAVWWYKQAAQAGHAEAQFRLGERYLLGVGVPESNDEARRWLEADRQ